MTQGEGRPLLPLWRTATLTTSVLVLPVFAVRHPVAARRQLDTLKRRTAPVLPGAVKVD